MENKNSGVNPRKKLRKKANFIAVCAIFFFFGLFFAVMDLTFIPPAGFRFPSEKIVKINEGFSLNESAGALKKEGIIKSEIILKIIVSLLSGDKKIKAGTYSFDKPHSAFEIAKKIIKGDYGIPFQKILIREGQTIEEIGKIFEREGLFKKKEFFAYTGCCAGKILPKENIEFFQISGSEQNKETHSKQNRKTLLEQNQETVSSSSETQILSTKRINDFFIIQNSNSTTTEPEPPRMLEGFFFPDTYFFPKNIEPKKTVEIALKNFTNKMSGEIAEEVKKSGKNFYDVLIIASILEKEAKTMEDKKMIADIIQRRLKAEMPLQVDASLDYILNKNTFELTKKDLAFDSPYNTYKYKGLPKTPISNPGLDSIRAALNPAPNDYWYYLSDKLSLIHYSKNYTEHKNKQQEYLFSSR